MRFISKLFLDLFIWLKLNISKPFEDISFKHIFKEFVLRFLHYWYRIVLALEFQKSWRGNTSMIFFSAILWRFEHLMNICTINHNQWTTYYGIIVQKTIYLRVLFALHFFFLINHVRSNIFTEVKNHRINILYINTILTSFIQNVVYFVYSICVCLMICKNISSFYCCKSTWTIRYINVLV